jgi:ubiquinone/menaquinone biosynthesis C-methylase UbiE
VEEPAVGVACAADTRQAFDSVAAGYDRANAENALLAAMRERTLAAVLRYAPPGSHLLDLGCGPGGDAAALAARGFVVTAIDASPGMVDEARERMRRARLTGRVAVYDCRIEDLDRLPAGQFEAAYSNFGPLNCVADLPAAAAAIGRRLRPGGALVASVIGRVCPWEIALYLARRDWPRARVRFARARVAVPLNGHTVWTQYYAPSEFARAFRSAGLAPMSLRALGLFVPPPYMQAFAARHPRAVAALQRLEDRVAGWPLLREAGDHFLMVLRKGGPEPAAPRP